LSKNTQKKRDREGGLILIHLVKLNLIFNDAEKISVFTLMKKSRHPGWVGLATGATGAAGAAGAASAAGAAEA
jgi:hypothetical protein